MRLDVSLWVSLKGVDLVATTAYLTLADKMGFRYDLFAIKRLEVCELTVECEDPGATSAALQRIFATQSSYYNRNKHNYSLVCTWPGGEVRAGVRLEETKKQLEMETLRKLSVAPLPDDEGGEEDLDSNGNPDRVILTDVPVYRTEVLIEDLDTFSRTALAGRLESGLCAGPVAVTALGTCWYLALAAGDEEDARDLAEQIVVTARRDRGLLLNPNDQGFRIIAVERVKAVS